MMNQKFYLLVGFLWMLAIIIILWGISRIRNKEEFCPSRISQHQPHPQQIQKPLPNPSTICTRPNGQRITCGYASRIHSEKDSTELKLCNKSPITLDIYHRLQGKNKFTFCGTIPTMQDLYVYKDKDSQSFAIGDELFATKHGDSKILYLPAILENQKNQIFFGASTAETDESIVIVNLISEIGHIKFRNYSYATYTLYYYGEYLGELKPYDKENNIYFELYVARSSQGFRLGSQVSMVMKGTNIVQNISLTHRRMTTLNVGLVTSQPNFSDED